MHVTRTIPRDESESHISTWFQGRKRKQFFPVKGRPADLYPGDYLYVIYRGFVYGRFRVLDIEEIPPDQQPIVGSRNKITAGTHNIVVEAPGERAPANLKIRRKGHQGIRYDPMPEWS